MQENDNSQFNFMSIAYALLKKWFLIVLITVLCALLGFGYNVIFIKPTYTATRSVMLRLSVGDLEAGTVTTNVTLSKIYLSDVKDFVSSNIVIEKANTIYQENGKIILGALKVGEDNLDYDSLIFHMSYTDLDKVVAVAKLDAIIESAMLVNDEINVIETEDFSLIRTQRDCTIVENNKFLNHITSGAIAGLLLSIAIVLIIYFTDTSIKSKDELEDIVGTDVLSNIIKK